VACGVLFSLALGADGSISAWGDDNFDQVKGRPLGTGFIQVAGGWGHALALGGDSGTPYCFGDGSGTPCPCDPGGSGEGCANSGGAGAALLITGTPYFSDDTLQLQVTGIPGAKAGLCVKGSSLLADGSGNVVGDGILCTTPQKRSQVIVSNASGKLMMTDWRGQPFGTFPGIANVGAPTHYQWWYRDPQSTCTGSGFNFTNAWTVDWVP